MGLMISRDAPGGVHGHLALTIFDAVTGTVVDRRESGNLIVTTGLNSLASALNWGFVQNYNTGWGNPFSASGANLGGFFGAVGTSSTAVAAGNTALGAEIGRQVITNAAVASNVLTYDFFIPTSVGNGSISEVGSFTSANYLAPTLTSALVNGSNYTSLAITGLVGTIPNGSTLTVGYSTSQIQTVTTTAQVTTGATSVAVTSFNANSAYAIGSIAAYAPGTLFDRAVFGSPVVKTATQTALLEITITLTSI